MNSARNPPARKLRCAPGWTGGLNSSTLRTPPMIIKTSSTVSKTFEAFANRRLLFYWRNGRRPVNSPLASRYQLKTALMRMMQEREQEGCSAGVNYLMVGWSRARGKLVGEGGHVQQGDWSSDGKAGRKKEHKRDTDKMSDEAGKYRTKPHKTSPGTWRRSQTKVKVCICKVKYYDSQLWLAKSNLYAVLHTVVGLK